MIESHGRIIRDGALEILSRGESTEVEKWFFSDRMTLISCIFTVYMGVGVYLEDPHAENDPIIAR